MKFIASLWEKGSPAALVATPIAADIVAARLLVSIEETIIVYRLLAIYHRRLGQWLGVLGVHRRHAHLWGWSRGGRAGLVRHFFLSDMRCTLPFRIRSFFRRCPGLSPRVFPASPLWAPRPWLGIICPPSYCPPSWDQCAEEVDVGHVVKRPRACASAAYTWCC